MTEKTQQEKNAAERQVALLSDALESARTHDGIWLNTKGKAAPRFYPRGVSVSAFNAVILGLHSDQNGYKTPLVVRTTMTFPAIAVTARHTASPQNSA